MPSALPGSKERFWITVSVMMATLVQVLDSTIVNVALPHMQGELGASSDQISWVLTSYLVSAAICMPLTGYFTEVLGRRRLLLISIAGFVVASALCGLSRTVFQIVVFRMLQGVFGASLVPLSQAILSDAYPSEERGKAMSIWGLGVMVGPVIGPTLGGWLTDIASWRWTFYINLPVGILSFFIAAQYVRETRRRERKFDWPGFGLLTLGVAALQYLLDRGNQQDWWSAKDIRVASVCSVVGIVGFVVYAVNHKGHTIFDLRILRDRNFAASCLLLTALGLGMFGGLILQPTLLEGVLGYPIVTTGLIMAPRGFATAVSMWIAGRLVTRFDARALVFCGMLISIAGTYAMTSYTLELSTSRLIWPAILQGIGLGLIFIPLSTTAYATLDRSRVAEAAGIYSLLRTIGSAVGISVVTTVMTRQTQVAWSELNAYINPFSNAFKDYLAPLNISPMDPQALGLVAQQVAQQAQMIAIIDAYKLIMLSYFFMVPLLLFFEKPKGVTEAPEIAMD